MDLIDMIAIVFSVITLALVITEEKKRTLRILGIIGWGGIILINAISVL